KRLAPGGIFAQWVQGYEVDPSTVRTVVATVAGVYPHVQIWRLHTKDIVLLASREPLNLDAATLRARMQQEPFKSGLLHAWRATDLESLLARHLARPSLARSVYEAEKELLNTDDQSHIEFAFAQTVGNALLTSGDEVLKVARARG